MDNVHQNQKYNKIINEEKNIIINRSIINDSKNITIYYYFYILRIISSFSVVLIHLTDYYKVKTRRKINSFDWKISYF